MKRLVFASMLTMGAALAQEHAASPAAEHHGDAAAADGGHSDLGVWKWANFAILAGLLAWAIGKNAGPFFRARLDEIQKDINDARAVRQEAEARAAAIEKRLANLDTELAALRGDARREMESEAARIQDETRRVLDKTNEQVGQEIAAMSKAAENTLRQEAARLALELAREKLQARMSPEAQGSLVTRFVAGLREQTANTKN